jgi:hypothetical protein
MDKIRKEFESWAISDMGYMVARVGDGYKCDYMNTAWLSWKASRAALCIELPENCKGMALTVSELHQQLDKAGVSYK